MNVCPRCGNFPRSYDRFCGRCGYNLTVPIQPDRVTQRDLNSKDIRKGLGQVLKQNGKHEEAEKILKNHTG